MYYGSLTKQRDKDTGMNVSEVKEAKLKNIQQEGRQFTVNMFPSLP